MCVWVCVCEREREREREGGREREREREGVLRSECMASRKGKLMLPFLCNFQAIDHDALGLYLGILHILF